MLDMLFFFVLLPNKSANPFLLHYQLFRYVAEHDCIYTFRQIAEVYSQSLLTNVHDIFFEFATLNIEQIHRRLLFQALDFQYCISIRRIWIQCKLSCVYKRNGSQDTSEDRAIQPKITRNSFFKPRTLYYKEGNIIVCKKRVSL